MSDQRMDRVERIAALLAQPDPRVRQQKQEQAEKIKIIVAAQQWNYQPMLGQSFVFEPRDSVLAAVQARLERGPRMPTVLRIGPYRFFFYSGDGGEPPHIHVVRDECVAKVWLDPVVLERSGDFRGTELNRVLKLVEEHREELLGGWNEYFDS